VRLDDLEQRRAGELSDELGVIGEQGATQALGRAGGDDPAARAGGQPGRGGLPERVQGDRLGERVIAGGVADAPDPADPRGEIVGRVEARKLPRPIAVHGQHGAFPDAGERAGGDADAVGALAVRTGCPDHGQAGLAFDPWAGEHAACRVAGEPRVLPRSAIFDRGTHGGPEVVPRRAVEVAGVGVERIEPRAGEQAVGSTLIADFVRDLVIEARRGDQAIAEAAHEAGGLVVDRGVIGRIAARAARAAREIAGRTTHRARWPGSSLVRSAPGEQHVSSTTVTCGVRAVIAARWAASSSANSTRGAPAVHASTGTSASRNRGGPLPAGDLDPAAVTGEEDDHVIVGRDGIGRQARELRADSRPRVAGWLVTSSACGVPGHGETSRQIRSADNPTRSPSSRRWTASTSFTQPCSG